MTYRDYDELPHKHRACPCGCGELADECMGGNPLNAFRIDAPERGIRIHLTDEQDED